MALRKIVEIGDDILRKKCRPVAEVNDRTRVLIDDMIETLHHTGGVGLAAPQVGVMRRLFVVDLGEEDTEPMVLVNPEFLEQSGEQDGDEGCLSIPGKAGSVVRPEYVKIKGLNRDGEEVVYEGTGLLARAFCHEYDHLEGIMYVDKAYELWELGDEEQ
ncbi:MAG: peptide deformylase [Firmicutes bacterium]|nr:peptide deformylase [Bacillota bacterium]